APTQKAPPWEPFALVCGMGREPEARQILSEPWASARICRAASIVNAVRACPLLGTPWVFSRALARLEIKRLAVALQGGGGQPKFKNRPVFPCYFRESY